MICPASRARDFPLLPRPRLNKHENKGEDGAGWVARCSLHKAGGSSAPELIWLVGFPFFSLSLSAARRKHCSTGGRGCERGAAMMGQQKDGGKD